MEMEKKLPHVIIFPLPLQGPVNCMLKLSEILCVNDIHVTFVITEHVNNRLLTCTNAGERSRQHPNFRFTVLPDGLPEDSRRTGDEIGKLIESMERVTWPIFRQKIVAGAGGESPENWPAVSLVIVDGVFGFGVDMSEAIGVPLIYFDTISPIGLWTYLCLPKLIESGEFPFKDDDLDAPIIGVPGMESILRRRDLPSFYRSKSVEEPIIKIVNKEAQHLPKAHGLIFNTFMGLDGPILEQFQSICPHIYAIGPLHTHLKTRMDAERPVNSNSLWKEDRSCMDWLDKQPNRSVIYVSIGSLAVISEDQLMELWHGLVKSGVRFLWVQRPGSIIRMVSDHENPNNSEELSQGTKERGCIVSWAPQEEVFAHPSVGAFLTHSGWNSTLESIVEGVPMICWPYFVDQQVNSRYVEEVWKLGLDMKDLCNRDTIERMVKDLMETRKDEFFERTNQMAKLAKDSVMEGGTSYQEMERLINDIKFMRIQM